MALITCPECSKPVSDQAPACPHCGLPRRPVLPLVQQASAGGGSSSPHRELRVASDATGEARSINEALGKAADGAIICLARGTYNETVTFTRSVTIVGDPGGEQPVIQAVGRRLITVDGATVVLRGVTLHCINPKSPAENGPAEDNAGVWCKSGHLSAESSRLICEQGLGLLVNGGANSVLRDCDLEGSNGVRVGASSSAKLTKTRLKAEYTAFDVAENASVSIAESDVRGSMAVIEGRLEMASVVADIRHGLNVSKSARASLTSLRLTGALHVKETSAVTLSQCDLEKCAMTFISNNATVTYQDCSIRSNTTFSCSDSSRLVINGCKGTGELMVSGKARLKMSKVQWECGKNQRISLMEEAVGEFDSTLITGSLGCTDSAKLQMTQSRVQVRQDDRYGSALSLSGERAETSINGCEILGNGQSNALYAMESHTLRVQKCRLSGHDKAVNLNEQVKATVEDCDLRGNSVPISTERGCRLRQSNNRS